MSEVWLATIAKSGYSETSFWAAAYNRDVAKETAEDELVDNWGGEKPFEWVDVDEDRLSVASGKGYHAEVRKIMLFDEMHYETIHRKTQ